jgi:hypothetical protein
MGVFRQFSVADPQLRRGSSHWVYAFHAYPVRRPACVPALWRRASRPNAASAHLASMSVTVPSTVACALILHRVGHSRSPSHTSLRWATGKPTMQILCPTACRMTFPSSAPGGLGRCQGMVVVLVGHSLVAVAGPCVVSDRPLATLRAERRRPGSLGLRVTARVRK